MEDKYSAAYHQIQVTARGRLGSVRWWVYVTQLSDQHRMDSLADFTPTQQTWSFTARKHWIYWKHSSLSVNKQSKRWWWPPISIIIAVTGRFHHSPLRDLDGWSIPLRSAAYGLRADHTPGQKEHDDSGGKEDENEEHRDIREANAGGWRRGRASEVISLDAHKLMTSGDLWL